MRPSTVPNQVGLPLSFDWRVFCRGLRAASKQFKQGHEAVFVLLEHRLVRTTPLKGTVAFDPREVELTKVSSGSAAHAGRGSVYCDWERGTRAASRELIRVVELCCVL